jgi:hypothetical protein
MRVSTSFKSLNNRNYVGTFLVFGLSLLSIGGYLVASRVIYGFGFPLDDAWIHQTYARNLAYLGEWSFIPGHPSAGSTSPAWSSLLAIGYLFHLGPYIWTFWIGWVILACLGLIGIWVFSNISVFHLGWSLAAGFLLIMEWHLVWAAASGMETGLFALLVLVVLGWLATGRPAWIGMGLMIGLSVWVRPDGLTLLGPAVFTLVMDRRPVRLRIIDTIQLATGTLALFVPYLIWNHALSGSIWPNTFYAKQAEYAMGLTVPITARIFEQAMLPNVGVGVLLLPGFVTFVYWIVRNRKWGMLSAAIWAVGYLFLYALRLPVTYQHGRYVIPMMPIYFLWGFAGVALVAMPKSASMWRRVITKAWLGSIAFVCLGFWILGARAYGRDVAFIDSEMVTAAKWVAQNTQKGDLIAAHDIGALGYFGQHNLLDLAGLVSPEVIPIIRNETRLAEWMTEQGADYLVTFPGWYPDLTAGLVPVFNTGGKYSQAFDGENMFVYRWKLRLR